MRDRKNRCPGIGTSEKDHNHGQRLTVQSGAVSAALCHERRPQSSPQNAASICQAC